VATVLLLQASRRAVVAPAMPQPMIKTSVLFKRIVPSW